MTPATNPPATPATASTGGLRIVIAPDSFKGSLTAAEAAKAIAAGWASERPQDSLVLKPMSDGGEGTADSFASAVPGAIRIPVRVSGPDDNPVDTFWVLIPPQLLPGTESAKATVPRGSTAVVELANTSGITLLDPLRPLDAHSVGFGEAIRAALEAGATRLVLAIGGSASTDGGTGMLEALGAVFTTADGSPMAHGGRGLADLATIDTNGLVTAPDDGVVVLTDVTNPLLGERGSARVFGPQKGADPDTIAALEDGLRHFAKLAGVAFATGGHHTSPDSSGAGAAGGTGYALALWGAILQSGARAVAELVGLDTEIDDADVVITGEGRFDPQSADGKVPSIVLASAQRNATPTLLIAGAITAPTPAFAATRSLTELAGSAPAALGDATTRLIRAGAELAESITTTLHGRSPIGERI